MSLGAQELIDWRTGLEMEFGSKPALNRIVLSSCPLTYFLSHAFTSGLGQDQALPQRLPFPLWFDFQACIIFFFSYRNT